MRARFLTLSLPLVFAALPLSAETLGAQSHVARVTLYPWGATVVRRVELAVSAGTHDLVIPDLPLDTDAATLRVSATGLVVGAISLAQGRTVPVDTPPSPEVATAQAEVARLEAVLRGRDAEIGAIRLKVQAAEDELSFLRGLGSGAALPDPAALPGLARAIGDQALAARNAAHAAELEAQAAERAREDDRKALEHAQAALQALVAGAEDHAALTMAVEARAAGPATVEITTFTGDASWAPVYDLRLSRGDTPTLSVGRGAVVSQSSGEDWLGAEVTLSTARPADRMAPETLWPDLRRIGQEEDAPAYRNQTVADAEPVVGLAAPEPAAVAEDAVAGMDGATVVWRYPAPVDLRDGVDSLRLRLGDLALVPEVHAVAIPRLEETAFLEAAFRNEGAEPLLPGQATLFLDGAMVGLADLPMIAAGDRGKVAFGPIDGLRLKRVVPERTEGNQGVLSKSNRIDEKAVLSVENLTGETWPVRLIDQVPYSEQEDLVIAFTADPAPSVQDLDDARGLLAWDFDLKPGARQEVVLQHSLTWPDGMVLR